MYRIILIAFTLLATPCLRSQEKAPPETKIPMNMGGAAPSFAQNILRHTGSGTSLEPASGAPPMLMQMRPNGWMLMLHGEASAVEQQQTGPRGHDKFFSVNWLMPMAQRELGACYEQFGLFGAGHAGTGVPSCEQPAVVKQVQPV